MDPAECHANVTMRTGVATVPKPPSNGQLVDGTLTGGAFSVSCKNLID